MNDTIETQAGWCRKLGLSSTALHYYMKTHSYEETALYISQLQHPDKEIPLVMIDKDLFENGTKERMENYEFEWERED